MTSINSPEIRVSVDVGCRKHAVAIGLSSGKILDEFEIDHRPDGFKQFFHRIEQQERHYRYPVVVAMEGYNGWARPLDTLTRLRNYRLFNINNLKLARFKEIFPAPAKSDKLDARRGLGLFQMMDTLPMAANVLQEVAANPEENNKLKRLTRRRKALVDDKTRCISTFQTDLQAVCPGLLEITGAADNLWFLRWIASVDDFPKLARLRRSTVLNQPGIGQRYADKIQTWQKQAHFSTEVEYVGAMILEDARRLLALHAQIKRLEATIKTTLEASQIGQVFQSLPGYGPICSAELAGEIGTPDRFAKESSLAVYLGMAALDNSSGTYRGSKVPRNVNKRAKAAMMIAVDRHRKQVEQSQTYYEKKRREGKKHNQAIRALGRHMVRMIFKLLKENRAYEVR